MCQREFEKYLHRPIDAALEVLVELILRLVVDGARLKVAFERGKGRSCA
jgi:hypothetical protein